MNLIRPLHLGLTGNIASGKSTVAQLLKDQGATIIDADQLAREAVALGTSGLDAVVAHFGSGMLAPDGSLDRSALGHLVFANEASRQALNAIVHPVVARLRAERYAEASARGDAVVISDIPLLYETGLERGLDGIIVVDAPEAVRRDRLMRRRGMSESDANARMDSQWPSVRKRANATWVIDNDGALDQLAGRVHAVWHDILALVERRRAAPAS